MDLSPFHPQIVHAPIALVIVGALFELIGRALDRAWWRQAAFAMLVVGVLGAIAAVLTGDPAEHVARRQGIADAVIEPHEELSKLSMWLGIAAVAVRILAAAWSRARPLTSALALILHLGVAVLLGFAGHLGGKLVYEHGAGVHADAVERSTPGD